MSRRVMVVEPQTQVLEIIRVSLEDFGFVVFGAQPDTAVTDAIENHAGVVIVDDDLGGFSGNELVQQLKSNPETSSMLVFLLASGSVPESQADLVLRKPFSPVTLLSEIHQSLDLELA